MNDTMSFKEDQQSRTWPYEEDKEAQHHAMQLISSSVVPMALKAAIELGVFEIIQSAGPGALLSSSQIASLLPSQSNPKAPTSLDRILRLLASHSILTFSIVTDQNGGQIDRLYGLAPVAKYFIRSPSGGSLSPLLDLYQDKVTLHSWYQLKDAVLPGENPFTKTHGMKINEYLRNDSRFEDVFHVAMINYNKLFVKEMLESYRGFDGLNSLVDVGGGNGFILHSIVSKYPSIKGINFDLPRIIDKSPSYPGVENVAGDAFETVPKGDAIFTKWLLQHFDDKRLVELLKNCYEALPASGKVIAVQMVIPEVPDANVSYKSAYQFDVYTLSMNEGAKDRTEREYESLAKEAGFFRFRVACCIFGFSVIEFYKNM